MYARKILGKDSGRRRNGRRGGRGGRRFDSRLFGFSAAEQTPEHDPDHGGKHDRRRGDDPFPQLRGNRDGRFQRAGNTVDKLLRRIAVGEDRVARHQCVFDQRRRRRTVQIDRNDVAVLRVELQEPVNLRRGFFEVLRQEEQNGIVFLRRVLRIDGEAFAFQRVEDRSDDRFVRRRKQRVQRASCHGMRSPFLGFMGPERL